MEGVFVAEAMILTNDMTVHGLRRLEVMQMGAAVEAAPWVESLPPFAAETVTLHRQYEEELGVHHLWLTWQPREVVGRPVEGVERGVYWWIGRDQRIREALADAAAWHFVMLDCWPTAAWIARMPKGMAAGTVVKLDMGERDGEIEVVLSEGAVARRFVVVGLTPIPIPLSASQTSPFSKGDKEGEGEKCGGEQ